MAYPRAILFDLDNTLSERVAAPSAPMAKRLEELLKVLPVGLITAASYPRLEQMFLTALTPDSNLKNLYLLPDMGGLCYHFENEWELLYENALSEAERAEVLAALDDGIETTRIVKDTPHFGDRIEMHEAQIIFTALGIDAPVAQKIAWDADGSKREVLKAFLEKRLPEFDVYIGGRTTIDITKKGFDKSYGVRRFAEHLQIDPKDMLYVGDELFPGGNDAPVIATGIQTKQVANPQETLDLIDELLAQMRG
jgi:phosphomannomutase